MGKKIHSDENTAVFKATLGQRIKRARRALGITQTQAADRIGISSEFFARIERGHGLPSVSTLKEIACALKVSVDFLFAADSNLTQVVMPSSSDNTPKMSRQVAKVVAQARTDEELRRLLIAVLKLADKRSQEPSEN